MNDVGSVIFGSTNVHLAVHESVFSNNSNKYEFSIISCQDESLVTLAHTFFTGKGSFINVTSNITLYINNLTFFSDEYPSYVITAQSYSTMTATKSKFLLNTDTLIGAIFSILDHSNITLIDSVVEPLRKCSDIFIMDAKYYVHANFTNCVFQKNIMFLTATIQVSIWIRNSVIITDQYYGVSSSIIDISIGSHIRMINTNITDIAEDADNIVFCNGGGFLSVKECFQ